jgi:hypothetical protein
MDEAEYWEPEGYSKDPMYSVPQELEEEEEELPSKVRYAKFQEENDFDPEP